MHLQHWRKLVIQDGGPCPEERSSHTAICLGYATAHPQLLVIGGYGGGIDIFNDAWMLDLQSERWKRVRKVLHRENCLNHRVIYIP